MSVVTSIPMVRNESFEGMDAWCREMADRGLLFHPDDPPETIEHGDTRSRMFTEPETLELKGILDGFLERHGDALYDVCLKHTRRRLGMSAD